MQKRGQVTIFMIFSFIILISFLFIFYTNRDVKDIKQKVETELETSDISFAEPVKNFVQTCLDDTTENSVSIIGIQGGYYNPPQYFFEDFMFFYSYHFVENQNIMPSKSEIENQIAEAVKRELPHCLDNFSIFKDQGFSIDQGSLRAAATIVEKEVVLDVIYPLSIELEGKKLLLSSFKSTVPSRLSTIYETTKYINDMQVQDPDNICLSCLIDEAQGKNLNLKIFSYDNGDIFFEIIDNETKLLNEPYSFIFGAKNEI